MNNISIEEAEVRSSLEVLDFMQDRQNDRHSKLQAYCSLLNKACSILVCLIITVLIVERIIVRTFTIQATIGEDILISTITLHRTE